MSWAKAKCVLHRQRFLDRHVIGPQCVTLATIDFRNAQDSSGVALYHKLRNQFALPTVLALQHCKSDMHLAQLRTVYPHEDCRRSAILFSRDPFQLDEGSTVFFQAISFPNFHVVHVHEQCQSLARRLALFRALNKFIAAHQEWPVFIMGLLGPRDELLFRQCQVSQAFIVPDTDFEDWNGKGHTPSRFFGQSSRRSRRVFDQHILSNNMFVYADNRAVAVGHNTMVVGHFLVAELHDLPFSSGWLTEGDLGPTLCASNRLMQQFMQWATDTRLVAWLRFVRKRNMESGTQPTRTSTERYEKRHHLPSSMGLAAQRDRLVLLQPSSSKNGDCWRVTLRGRFVLCCAKHRVKRKRPAAVRQSR